MCFVLRINFGDETITGLHTFHLFIISLLPSSGADSCTGSFDTLTWDFGTVAEAGGRVTHRFGFANRIGRPVVVTDVVATCGCTVPVYSKRPVLAGERSEIAVTFDPMNRPGRFDKAVSVFTSESGDPIRLRITGRVTPRERSVEELYPCDLGGGLRAATTSHAFGYVRHAQPQRSAIGLVNLSSEPIELTLRYGRRAAADGELRRARPAVGSGRRSISDTTCLPDASMDVEDDGLSVDGAPGGRLTVVSGIAVDNPLCTAIIRLQQKLLKILLNLSPAAFSAAGRSGFRCAIRANAR